MSPHAGPSQPTHAPENTTGDALTSVAERLHTALDDLPLPEPQKREVFTRVREVMFALIDRSGVPRLDPETTRLLTDAATRDADNKFKYLTQKQSDLAEDSRRKHEFDVRRHEDAVRMIWPILIAVLFVIIGALGFGCWLIAIGRDSVGIPIVTAIISGILAYLAGFGTPRDLWTGRQEES
jgi:hypothetical protein